MYRWRVSFEKYSSQVAVNLLENKEPTFDVTYIEEVGVAQLSGGFPKSFALNDAKITSVKLEIGCESRFLEINRKY